MPQPLRSANATHSPDSGRPRTVVFRWSDGYRTGICISPQFAQFLLDSQSPFKGQRFGRVIVTGLFQIREWVTWTSISKPLDVGLRKQPAAALPDKLRLPFKSAALIPRALLSGAPSSDPNPIQA
jgi:hypothetical protein